MTKEGIVRRCLWRESGRIYRRFDGRKVGASATYRIKNYSLASNKDANELAFCIRYQLGDYLTRMILAFRPSASSNDYIIQSLLYTYIHHGRFNEKISATLLVAISRVTAHQ